MRKIRGCIVAGVLVFIAACGSVEEISREEPASGASDGAHLVSAYHPWWTQNAWRAYTPGLYDEVFFFSLEIDSSGAIVDRNGWPDRWYDMQQFLSNGGSRVTPVVTLFSQQAFERLFRDPTSSRALLENLVEVLRDSPSVGGLQLDFEVYRPVPGSVRDGFTEFIRDLRVSMDEFRPDLRLSMYLVAYDESDVFDEAALADVTDYLVVQGYDLHSRGEGRTGPVAALEGWGSRNWKTIVSRLVELGVPRSKIVMSVPYFGYEWPAESDEPGSPTRGVGRTVGFAGADSAHVTGGPPSALEMTERHGLRRDPVSGSPYYAYEDSTGWRQGWFEDAASLAEKYQFVVDEGLRGVAVFPPAYGNEELSGTLARIFSPETSQAGPQ